MSTHTKTKGRCFLGLKFILAVAQKIEIILYKTIRQHFTKMATLRKQKSDKGHVNAKSDKDGVKFSRRTQHGKIIKYFTTHLSRLSSREFPEAIIFCCASLWYNPSVGVPPILVI